LFFVDSWTYYKPYLVFFKSADLEVFFKLLYRVVVEPVDTSITRLSS